MTSSAPEQGRGTELSLLACVLTHGRWALLEREGVCETHFLTRDGREVYRWIVSYRRQHAALPRIEEARGAFRGLPLKDPHLRDGDTPETEIRRLIRDLFLNGEVAHFRKKLAKLQVAFQDPDAIPDMAALREMLDRDDKAYNRRTGGIQGMSMLAAGAPLLEAYRNIQSGVDEGISFPWAPLQRAVRGMRSADVHVVFGPTKNGKTWLALAIANHAFTQGFRTSVCSAEMGTKELATRLASIKARVDYRKVEGGPASFEDAPEDEQRYIQTLEGLHAAPDQRRPIGDPARDMTLYGMDAFPSGRMTVDGLRQIAHRDCPDLLVIDAVYMMTNARGEDGTEPRVQAQIAGDLKHLAGELKIPILVVTQANLRRLVAKEFAGGATGHNAAMSYAQEYVANCTSALFVELGRDTIDPSRCAMYVTNTANRRGAPAHTFSLHYAPGSLDLIAEHADKEEGMRLQREHDKGSAARAREQALRNDPTVGTRTGQRTRTMPEIL